MAGPILIADHVSVRGFETDILQDISISLEPGQILAVVGPNGAGKTTLMKALLGLIPHTGSVVWTRGTRVGYVPQKVLISRSLPLTVSEFFSLKSKNSFWSSNTQTLSQWVERVGAQKLLKKRLADLSGGELQRVLIAYALLGDADVLCLDEPSAGIDVGGGETVYGLLSELSDEHRRTIILISHDLDVVFRYADQVLCIDKRMICTGRPASVLTAETLERMYGHHAGLYSHHDHA